MSNVKTVSLIEGDGIGPEIAAATVRAIEAAGGKLVWERVDAGAGAVEKHKDPLPQATIDSIKKNQLALKGPLATPSGGGYRSVNVTLRQQFDLYANVRPVETLAGVPSRYTNVDLVIVRENTEDLYAGVEHYVDPRRTAAESIAIITKFGSERCIRYAFARDLVDPGVMHVSEAWRDRDALKAHGASAHMREWQAAIGSVGVSERDLKLYDTDEGTPL